MTCRIVKQLFYLLHLPSYEAGVAFGWPSRPAFKPCSMPCMELCCVLKLSDMLTSEFFATSCRIVKQAEDDYMVTFKDGSGAEHQLQCGLVMFATGRAPRSMNIGVDAVGVS
jgi:hypothetical protein